MDGLVDFYNGISDFSCRWLTQTRRAAEMEALCGLSVGVDLVYFPQLGFLVAIEKENMAALEHAVHGWDLQVQFQCSFQQVTSCTSRTTLCEARRQHRNRRRISRRQRVNSG